MEPLSADVISDINRRVSGMLAKGLVKDQKPYFEHIMDSPNYTFGNTSTAYAAYVAHNADDYETQKAKRKACGAHNQTPIPCSCKTVGKFNIGKHAVTCRHAVDGFNWLYGNAVPTTIPSSTGWSGGGFINQTTWPALTVSLSHIRQALEGINLWKELVNSRVISKDLNDSARKIIVRFDPGAALRMPAFSNPILVSQSVRETSGEISLHGVAAELDETFLDTQAGAAFLQNVLVQMANHITTTQDFNLAMDHVLTARANCEIHPELRRRHSIDNYHDDLASTFAMFQRTDPTAFGQVERYMMRKLDDYNSGASTTKDNVAMIIPSLSSDLLLRANSNVVANAWAGYAGPRAHKSGDYLGKTFINDREVYQVFGFKFPGSDGPVTVNPLEYRLTVGEYATMIDRTPPNKRFVKRNMDREIPTSNGYVEVTLVNAIENCPAIIKAGQAPVGHGPQFTGSSGEGYFGYQYDNNSGMPSTPKDVKPATTFGHLFYVEGGIKYGVAYDGFGEAVKDDIDWVTTNARGESIPPLNFKDVNGRDITVVFPTDFDKYCKLPFIKETCIYLVKHGVRLPFGFILAQAHQHVTALDAVAAVKQQVTEALSKPGNIIIGVSDTGKRQINAQAKLGSIIIDSRNCAAARAIEITSCVSGFGVSPVIPERYQPNSMGDNYGDMFYLMVPYGWKNVPRNLSLLPYFDKLGSRFYDMEQSDYQRMHGYPSNVLYDAIYGFTTKKLGFNDRRQTIGIVQAPWPTNAILREMTYHCPDKDGIYSLIVAGNGYWRRDGSSAEILSNRGHHIFPVAQLEAGMTPITGR
jgi:hypothetical protein